MKKLQLVIYVFSLLITTAYAQEVRVSSSFDTTDIFIGDQIIYTITVDQPDGMQLTLPEFRDTLITNIEILAGPLTDTLRNIKGVLQIKKEYLVTSFDSGLYQLQPVYAELKNEDGLKRFYSDYAFLRVSRTDLTPSDSTARIFDIIAPYRAPLTAGDLLPWIFLVIFATAVVYYLIRLFKKLHKKKETPGEVLIPDPAHVIAFRDLENLRDEKLWQQGEVKQYYSRLTEILRQYLENRFRVYSLELTTSETLEALLHSGFSKNSNYRILSKVLSGADMVKFAKYNPEPAENEAYFQDAWSFVSETKEAENSAIQDNLKAEKGEDAV